MLELLLFAVMVVLLPTCTLALASWGVLFLWSLLARRPMDWKRPWAALLAALRLKLLFLVVGGLVIGVTFGKALYLGYPILMAILTLCVGAIGYVCFVLRGIPPWMEWRKWMRVIFPAP